MIHRIDNGRVQLNVSDTLCQVAVESAKSKDEGRWDFAVSTTNDFWNRKHIIHKVFVNGKQVQLSTAVGKVSATILLFKCNLIF